MNCAQVETPGETIPQPAYPKCSPLLTEDSCTQQQHECCTPGQLGYAVRGWVCSTPSALCRGMWMGV